MSRLRWACSCEISFESRFKTTAMWKEMAELLDEELECLEPWTGIWIAVLNLLLLYWSEDLYARNAQLADKSAKLANLAVIPLHGGVKILPRTLIPCCIFFSSDI